MIDLDALVSSAERMEPPPATVSRLAALIARGDTDLREVAKLLAMDQVLAGSVLRLANSARFGGNARTATVQDAVVRLGAGEVLCLCVSAALKSRLSAALPQYGLAAGELFRHSLCAAIAAMEIGACTKSARLPPETHTAALLHDIGKLALARYLAKGVLAVLTEARDVGQIQQLEAERTVLGVEHAELGAMIAAEWRLPAGIVHGIKFHHDPAAGRLHHHEYANASLRPEDFDAIAYGVHVADSIACEVAAAEGSTLEPSAPLVPGALEFFGMTQTDVDRCRDGVATRARQALAELES